MDVTVCYLSHSCVQWMWSCGGRHLPSWLTSEARVRLRMWCRWSSPVWYCPSVQYCCDCVTIISTVISVKSHFHCLFKKSDDFNTSIFVVRLRCGSVLAHWVVQCTRQKCKLSLFMTFNLVKLKKIKFIKILLKPYRQLFAWNGKAKYNWKC